jgi:uncharacterized membrane protein
MEKFSITKFVNTIAVILLIFFGWNCIKFIIALFKVNFHIENFAYQNGHFILNDKQIGGNIFGNIVTIAVLYVVYLYYQEYRKKKLEEKHI